MVKSKCASTADAGKSGKKDGGFGKSVFDKTFVQNCIGFGIFLAIYTAAFLLFYWTASYTFPFVVAFAIAFLMQPIVRFFRTKLKMRKNIPSLLASFLVFILFFALIALLLYRIVNETAQLVASIPHMNLDVVINPIKDFYGRLEEYFKGIDMNFIEQNSSKISDILSNGLNVLGKSLSTFLSLAVSIPMWIAILFIVILATYFFSRDMGAIRERIMSILSESGKVRFSQVWSQGIRMLGQYVKAYAIIYSLTFLQTLIGFSILGVKYAVILSVICAVADILPVLGIGIIYLPIAAIYLITGNYFTAIGLVVLYILISVVRQIVEPKIVSTSLGIHPVLVLAAIFIGLKAAGFIGMIYLTFMVVLYKVLKTSKVF